MSNSAYSAILREAIVRYGQSAEMEAFLNRIMHVESSGDARIKNPNSSATGLFQFTSATWSDWGKGGDIYDPKAQCDAGVRFTMNNVKVLCDTLGRAPNRGEYYLAHFAGPSGARAILTAAPQTPISELLGSKAVAQNAGIKFRGKAFGDWTAQDIQDWAATRMNVDIDARAQYTQRYKAGKTTSHEDAEELAVRRRYLNSFGIGDEMAQKFGVVGILGDVFIALIKFLMDESAPSNERNMPPATRDSQTVLKTVQRTQVAAIGQNRKS